ncbi:MAG: putative ABC transport system permease protein [Phenylobacterium sp.]|jgi:putative ABC transport system permease protein
MKTNYEVGPIIRALRRKKTSVILITLQIAITLAVVVNALFIINDRVEKISMPIGSDTENIFNLNVVSLSEGLNHPDMMREDLRVIRSISGVENAIAPINYLQSGSTRYEFYRAKQKKVRGSSIFTNVNFSDEHGLEALGVSLLAGRFFQPQEVGFMKGNFDGIPNVVVVTQALGRKLFPEGNIVGRSIYWNDTTPIEIIGVISNVATGWLANGGSFLADTKYNLMLHPFATYHESANYLVRAKPGMLSSIMPEVEKALMASDSNRLLRRVQTQEEVLRLTFANDYATLIILIVVVVLMLLITGLGIVGLAAYSVKQRTRQIGTRRAMGARKKDILRHFVVENLILTTMGVIIGIILTYALNYFLSSQFGGERLDANYLPAGIGILYLLGLVAVYFPAYKAASISPAIATRA